ncbi:MAG: TetR family transcriptional regulator [Neptuniibacter sp.]
MPRRTKEEAEKTRQHLLETALRLFADRGISRTSLKDVAAEAGLTHGALYWHFKNRTDLLEALYEECRFPIDDLYIDHLQSSRQNALEALENFLTQWCLLICEDERAASIWRVFHNGVESEPELSALAERIHDEHLEWLEYLARFIKHGRKQNRIADRSAKKDPLPAVSLAVVKGVISTIDILGRDNIKLKQHIAQAVSVFLYGLGERS